MRNIIKTIVASILGIVISLCVYELTDALNAKLYPSSRMQPTYEERLKDLEHMPLNAMLIVLLGYTVSSFMGGYTAARIAPDGKKMLAAMSVGFFLLLGGIVYFMVLPHAIWLTLSSCMAYLTFSFLGGKTASRK